MAMRASLRPAASLALLTTRPLLTNTVLPLCCTAALKYTQRHTRHYATTRNRKKKLDKVTENPDAESESSTAKENPETESKSAAVQVESGNVEPSISRITDVPVTNSLRPYQDECIEAVMEYLAKGDKRLGISLATGSGKTVIFTNIIPRIPAPSPERTQTIILVHRLELAEQAYKVVKSFHPNLRVELEMGDKHSSGTADVTIAMVQSLVASDGKRLEKFNPDTHKLVMLDECHHAVSKTWLRVLNHMKIWDEDGPVTLGFSATMHRADGMGLGKVLQRIVYHKDFMDMAKDKWLSDSIFTTVRTMVNLSSVPVVGGHTGDFNVAELSKKVNTVVSNDIVVKAWQSKCVGRKSTLVFCVDVQHVVDLTHAFRFSGIDARAVVGTTPLLERKKLVESFKAGEFPVLVNCGLFTEGTDIPNIDCIVLARPTRSKALMTQMIGRGMRLHPEKINVHILDIACALTNGVLTTPTLFGLDPDELLDETPGSALSRRSTEIDLSPPPPAPIPGETDPLSLKFTDYTSIMDLLEDTRPDQHVRSISQYAWVQCSPHKWILQCGGHGFIRIERCPETNTFSAAVVRGLLFPDQDLRMATRQNRILLPPKDLFTDIELFENAIHGADTYATSHFPRNLILTNASWRRAKPSTSQFQMLEKILNKEIRPGALEYDKWTKGKVADMITKMKYGAKSVWAEAQRDLWRAQQAREKAAAREAASTIKVGELLQVADRIDFARAQSGRKEPYSPFVAGDGALKKMVEQRGGTDVLRPFVSPGRGVKRLPSPEERSAILSGKIRGLEYDTGIKKEEAELWGVEPQVDLEQEVRRDLERERVLSRLLVRKMAGKRGVREEV